MPFIFPDIVVCDPSENELFSGNEIEPLLRAFEAVCDSLHILSRHDPLAEIVALKVVQVAKSADCDSEQLRNLVLLALKKSDLHIA
jgi:hypothetical protein